MKLYKILLFIATLAFPNCFQARNIERIYEFSHPVITASGDWSQISFEGTRQFGEPGRPVLPFFPVKLLLPPGEVAVSITISYQNEQQLESRMMLAPGQAYRPLSFTGSPDWQIDQQFYQSRDVYPADGESVVHTHFYNGSGIALSYFTPVRFYPAEGRVSYFERVVVVIETGPDPDAGRHAGMFFPDQSKRALLEKLIQNPEDAALYFSGRDLRSPGYDYLIITTSQFAANFDTLVSFYKPRGIKSEIKTLEQITATMPGSDAQEKIRNFIIQEYQNNGIEFVLIAGDAEVIPYRGFYCQVLSGGSYYTDGGIPADLYYSALDGNWNSDGDNLWAEPNEDDLYPEVGIGRLPFSNAEELQNMLHKTMLYQSAPVQGELNRPLLAGEHLYYNPVTWGSNYLRLLVGLRSDHGYTTLGIPPAHPRDTLYDATGYNWSTETLLARINAGRPWVHHVGHASQLSVMKMIIYDITNENFSQANGVTHNFPVVYTHGCTCGAFDYDDCIGERMVSIDNFAAAFIGNSRYGWFNEGTTDGPSQHLHREFMDALYRDSLYHLGAAHLQSKSETAPWVEMAEWEPGATRWCFYDNNLLGDPLMAAWTDEPTEITVGFSHMIPIGAQTFAVNVGGAAGNFSGITCTLYSDDTLFGTSLTDDSGHALVLADEFLSEGPIWLVVTGNNILAQWFPVHVCDYWLGYNSDWNDPSNWFSGNIPDQNSRIIIPSAPAGGFWPETNSGASRICKSVMVESGARFSIQPGDTFVVQQQ